MKAIVSMCVFGAVIVAVAAAPTLKEGVVPQQPEGNFQQAIVREKRSQYGAPSYGAPNWAQCGGIAPYPGLAPLPIAPLPAPASYLPAHASYGTPHGYGYSAPHYRADDMGDDHETLVPDMENSMTEHFPMARYGGYGVPAVHGLSGYGGIGSGPAYGVFPNANVGGCNVPLLLSCSPSIVPGRLVKSQGYGGGYGVAPANSYRGADNGHTESHEDQLQLHPEEHEAAHEQLVSVNEGTHGTSSQQ